MKEEVKSKKKGKKLSKRYNVLIKKKEKDSGASPTKQSKRKNGVVYFGNIPPGFYEHEMQEYFSQFGKVSRLRLCRSKKTGKSKGYAYIEYLVPEVAQIVAQTMNGYLMYKRVLKARYIPPEAQRMNYFPKKTPTDTNFPRKHNRDREISRLNAMSSIEKHRKKVRILLQNVKKVQDTLAQQGVRYNFTAVGLPEDMVDCVEGLACLTEIKKELLTLKSERVGLGESSGANQKSKVEFKKLQKQHLKNTKTKLKKKKRKLASESVDSEQENHYTLYKKQKNEYKENNDKFASADSDEDVQEKRSNKSPAHGLKKFAGTSILFGVSQNKLKEANLNKM